MENTLIWQEIDNSTIASNDVQLYSYRVTTLENGLYYMCEYYNNQKDKEYAVVDDLEYAKYLAQLLACKIGCLA